MSLHESFEEERNNFIASPCHQRLLETLERNRPKEGWHIPTAVLMALGSLVVRHDRRSQLHQLAVFLEIVQYLQKTTHSTIQTFAQDPEFRPESIEFLKSLGIEVVWEPQAERLSRAGCFTMAPFYGWDDTLIARERELRPIVYIGLPLEHVKSNARTRRTPQEMEWLNDCGAEYDCFRVCPDDCAHVGNCNYNLSALEVYCLRTIEQADQNKKERMDMCSEQADHDKKETDLRREQDDDRKKEKEKIDSP